MQNSSVAINANGQMIAVWKVERPGMADPHIYGRLGDLSAGWYDELRELNGHEMLGHPTGALWTGRTSDGGAFMLWSEDNAEGSTAVIGRIMSPDGTWDDRTTVARGLNLTRFGGPSVASSPSGDILIAWQQVHDTPIDGTPTLTSVRAVQYTPGRGWGAAERVAEEVRYPCEICGEGEPDGDHLRQAVLGACGEAVVVFAEQSDVGEGGLDILASVRGSDGAWRPAQRLNASGTALTGSPRIAMTPEGLIHTWWHQWDEGRSIPWASWLSR